MAVVRTLTTTEIMVRAWVPLLYFACADTPPAPVVARAATPTPVAPAAPAPPPPAAPPACATAGVVLFQKRDHGIRKEGATTTLHASGGWVYERRDRTGALVESRTGCIPQPRLQELADKAAKLTFGHVYPRGCRGRADFDVVVRDRVVFSGNHCAELDTPSAFALREITGAIVP